MMDSPPACRAVVFDLDGTLLNTLDDIAEAANRVLADFGFPIHKADDYRQYVGSGVTVLFERALPREHVEPNTVARCAAAFTTAYERSWNVRSRPYAGITALLDALTERRVRMAVLSNKPDDFTRRCMAHYFSAWKFEPILGQREGVARKPDPAGALEIARHWKRPPGEILYLGDSSIDMRTALAAGMYPVGAAWGFRSIDELRASGAAAIIAQPQELLRFVDGVEAP